MKPRGQNRIERLAHALDRPGGLDAVDLDEELRELVSTARALSDRVTVPAPDPAFRTRLRSELVARADEHTAPPFEADELLGGGDRRGAADQGAGPHQDPGQDPGEDPGEDTARDPLRRVASVGVPATRLILAAALATITLGTAAVASTASQAEPGEALYNVKLWTESARMALASGSLETGRLHMRLAEERLQELTEGLTDGPGELPQDVAVSTLEAMDEHTRTATWDLLAAQRHSGDDGLVRELEDFLAGQERGLGALPRTVPSGLVPFVEDSLELVRQMQAQLPGSAGACPDCGTDGEPLSWYADRDGSSDTQAQAQDSDDDRQDDSSRTEQTSSADGADSATETGQQAVDRLGEVVDWTADQVAGTLEKTTSSVADALDRGDETGSSKDGQTDGSEDDGLLSGDGPAVGSNLRGSDDTSGDDGGLLGGTSTSPQEDGS